MATSTLTKNSVAKKPAFLSAMSDGGKTGKGGLNAKPKWDGNVSAKRLVHFIAGVCFDEEGRRVDFSDTRPRTKVYFLTYDQVRKVLAIVHPVLNRPVENGGVPKGTIKGTWMRHGRTYSGGTPANPGLHAETWTDERKRTVLSAIAKVTGADTSKVSPQPKQ